MATIGSTGHLFSDHPGVRENYTLALDLLGQPSLKSRVAVLSESLVSRQLDVTEEMEVTLTEFKPSTFRLSVYRDGPPALDQEAMQTILGIIYEANATLEPEDFSVEVKPGVEGSFLIRPNLSLG